MLSYNRPSNELQIKAINFSPSGRDSYNIYVVQLTFLPTLLTLIIRFFFDSKSVNAKLPRLLQNPDQEEASLQTGKSDGHFLLISLSDGCHFYRVFKHKASSGLQQFLTLCYAKLALIYLYWSNFMSQIVLPHGSNLQVFLKGQNGLVGQELLSVSLIAHISVI